MKEQKQEAIKRLKELLNPIEKKYIPEILDDIFDSENTEDTEGTLNTIHTTLNFIKREEIINIQLEFKNNRVHHIIGKLRHVESHTEVEEYRRRFSTSLRFSTQHKENKVILHNFTFKIAI
jgi:hypothetical protein